MDNAFFHKVLSRFLFGLSLGASGAVLVQCSVVFEEIMRGNSHTGALVFALTLTGLGWVGPGIYTQWYLINWGNKRDNPTPWGPSLREWRFLKEQWSRGEARLRIVGVVVLQQLIFWGLAAVWPWAWFHHPPVVAMEWQVWFTRRYKDHLQRKLDQSKEKLRQVAAEREERERNKDREG